MSDVLLLQEDWESDVAESPMPSPFEQAEETKEEREEREKREFLEALRRCVAFIPFIMIFCEFFLAVVNISVRESDPVLLLRDRVIIRHHRALEEGSSDKPHEEPMDTSAPATDEERGLGRIFEGEGDMLEEHEVVEREKSALEILEVNSLLLVPSFLHRVVLATAIWGGIC